MVAGVLTAVVVIAGVSLRSRTAVEPTPVAFSDFLRDIKADRVKSVVADADAIRFELRDGARLETTAPPGYIALNPTFLSGLIERGVQFSATPIDRASGELYQTLAIGLFVFAVAGLVLFRVTGSRHRRSRRCGPSIPTTSRSPSTTWRAWTKPRTRSGRSSIS